MRFRETNWTAALAAAATFSIGWMAYSHPKPDIPDFFSKRSVWDLCVDFVGHAAGIDGLCTCSQVICGYPLF